MTTERAIFAGGCFWCMVQPFEEQPGIQAVTSGYIGGELANPTYEQVKLGTSGHYEAVEILFDPTLYTYTQLLNLFWPQIDPTDPDGQFHDRGSQYRTAIFYTNNEQLNHATQSKNDLESSGRFTSPIVTEIKPATTFYPAEAEHQQFYKTNPAYYKTDRKASGRDEFIRHHWE
ncbi:methionine sulfoxide reductase A [Bacillaceae bacterium JMAK1]|nr:methionine sulfoxide reductase A [Bacillaceae bacterium JMAK1]